ncbi:MAG: 2-dehydropantoate 2-reductase [Lachnospiraceae bacterium]|nr:2-dehydropantoate 2-reductase [Lachnospiraceae bacterium]
MKIYVDYDDCLCETARYFSELLADFFGKDVPYEKIKYFELDKSFSLPDEQYEELMIEGHKPERLLAYDETPGASKVINDWLDRGWEVSVITGRPFSAYEPSREWLDNHGFERIKLYCLNKYGRDSFIKNSDFSLEIEDYMKMRFDIAIEDSPKAFKFFDHLPDLKVMVFDRPWNQECVFPNGNYRRYYDWESISKQVREGA